MAADTSGATNGEPLHFDVDNLQPLDSAVSHAYTGKHDYNPSPWPYVSVSAGVLWNLLGHLQDYDDIQSDDEVVLSLPLLTAQNSAEDRADHVIAVSDTDGQYLGVAAPIQRDERPNRLEEVDDA